MTLTTFKYNNIKQRSSWGQINDSIENNLDKAMKLENDIEETLFFLNDAVKDYLDNYEAMVEHVQQKILFIALDEASRLDYLKRSYENCDEEDEEAYESLIRDSENRLSALEMRDIYIDQLRECIQKTKRTYCVPCVIPGYHYKTSIAGISGFKEEGNTSNTDRFDSEINYVNRQYYKPKSSTA